MRTEPYFESWSQAQRRMSREQALVDQERAAMKAKAARCRAAELQRLREAPLLTELTIQERAEIAEKFARRYSVQWRQLCS